MHSRRTVLSGALALAACRAPGDDTETVLRLATYRGNVETYMAAAGLKPLPFRVAPAQFASGNLIAEALIAGALDLGSMSDIPPVFVAQRRTPLRLVAVLKGDVANQLVLVPRGSRLTRLDQLRGKRIGYVRATTSHYILLTILNELGLGIGDVQAIALSPQDGRAAFDRGDLDAWIIFGATAFLARAETGARVLANGVGRLSGNYVYAAAAPALADPARRGAIAAYLRRVRDTYAWTEANPGEASRLVATATGVPQAIYDAMRRERSAPPSLVPPDAAAIASQQRIADAFARAGMIPAAVDVSPLWERGFDYRTA